MLERSRDLRAALRTVGKPRAVEGVLDVYLIRPSGFLLAMSLRSTALSPTALSIAGVAAGWISAFFFYETARLGNDPRFAGWALLSLFIHSAFDSADGQLARWKGQASEFGRLVDGICDYLTFSAIYVGVALGLWRHAGGGGFYLSLLTLAAGASHAIQSALVEYQRNLYREITSRTDRPAAAAPVENARNLSRNVRGSARAVHRLHLLYARFQQVLCGSSRTLRDRLGSLPPDLSTMRRKQIVRSRRVLLPAWSLLASNSHKVGMVAAAFLPVSQRSILGTFGLGWYLFYVVIFLNLWMLGLIVIQARSDRETWARARNATTSPQRVEVRSQDFGPRGADS